MEFHDVGDDNGVDYRTVMIFRIFQRSRLPHLFTPKPKIDLDSHLPSQQKEKASLARKEILAIRISNVANMVLFVAKVYASVRSGSLAIIASTLDSLLDLLSGFILWFTAFSTQTPSPYQYPIGKRRMQPLVSLLFFTLASIISTGNSYVCICRGNSWAADYFGVGSHIGESDRQEDIIALTKVVAILDAYIIFYMTCWVAESFFIVCYAVAAIGERLLGMSLLSLPFMF
ncbi:hypothetical protein L1987_55839 [Smallanthus sonchifolius]|uniref:Uncharacterized protein n=1 Tax=Smallanthus sonchifolius TaxID=185202 RepID=A0ACB9EC60_9ASTR|nr:hypothetical protein L1987_55839 [Smallanthus sonchifolius]